jgi:hypothetical protein
MLNSLQDVDNIKDTFQETLGLITQFNLNVDEKSLPPNISELTEQLVETTTHMESILTDLSIELIKAIINNPPVLQRQTCEQLPKTNPKLVRQNGYLTRTHSMKLRKQCQEIN